MGRREVQQATTTTLKRAGNDDRCFRPLPPRTQILEVITPMLESTAGGSLARTDLLLDPWMLDVSCSLLTDHPRPRPGYFYFRRPIKTSIRTQTLVTHGDDLQSSESHRSQQRDSRRTFHAELSTPFLSMLIDVLSLFQPAGLDITCPRLPTSTLKEPPNSSSSPTSSPFSS